MRIILRFAVSFWVCVGFFCISQPELFFDTILLVLGYLGSIRDSHVVRVVENRAACGNRILLA